VNGQNAAALKRIEFRLSALGVESYGFPNIDAIIDVQNDTSYCMVSYYEPNLHDTAYKLTKQEMDKIRFSVTRGALKRLKPKYEVSSTDLPTSTTIFYCSDKAIKIEDYGLEGPLPLQELYVLVYKLNHMRA
jgi:hypothetical protein